MNIFKGLSLIEVLIAMSIIGLISLFMFMFYPVVYESASRTGKTAKAFEAARKEMDLLENTNFTLLYNKSYDPASLPVINKFNITNLPNSSGVYYITKMKDTNSTILDDLLGLEVVVCINTSTRMLGEDLNLNGILDSGEDRDGNNKIGSPVTLKTLILKQ